MPAPKENIAREPNRKQVIPEVQETQKATGLETVKGIPLLHRKLVVRRPFDYVVGTEKKHFADTPATFYIKKDYGALKELALSPGHPLGLVDTSVIDSDEWNTRLAFVPLMETEYVTSSSAESSRQLLPQEAIGKMFPVLAFDNKKGFLIGKPLNASLNVGFPVWIRKHSQDADVQGHIGVLSTEPEVRRAHSALSFITSNTNVNGATKEKWKAIRDIVTNADWQLVTGERTIAEERDLQMVRASLGKLLPAPEGVNLPENNASTFDYSISQYGSIASRLQKIINHLNESPDEKEDIHVCSMNGKAYALVPATLLP